MTANPRADLLALAEECERAERGSRELSDRCLLAWGWRFIEYHIRYKTPAHWRAPDGKRYEDWWPYPTENLDACAAAMPEGWWLFSAHEIRTMQICVGDMHEPTGEWECELQRYQGGLLTVGKSSSLPLAWTAAICRALAADLEQQEKQP